MYLVLNDIYNVNRVKNSGSSPVHEELTDYKQIL